MFMSLLLIFQALSRLIKPLFIYEKLFRNHTIDMNENVLALVGDKIRKIRKSKRMS
jgi:hypothetical protein